ncbi:hypothetical protein [Streptomyces griseus]|uniref:hypothetical protein n=1 Tax=Streptomyces griseus TaxID=1911 RepID=UPI00131B6C98|nr:hypothetical protein [Streptomyces griseus]
MVAVTPSRLRHNGDLIVMSPSKRSWQASVEREELEEAFTGFLQEAYLRLTQYSLKLAMNPVIQRFSVSG